MRSARWHRCAHLTLRDCLTRGATAAHTSRRDRGRRRHRQRHERGQCRRTAHEERQRIALARRRAARRDAERMICCTLREDLLVEVSKLAREGRDDYLLVESRGNSEPLPAAEPRLGRRTALPFPLLPPPRPAPRPPGRIPSLSRASPVRGSTRLTSLWLPAQVPCQSSPSTQVTPVTKRLDSMVRRIAPVSGST